MNFLIILLWIIFSRISALIVIPFGLMFVKVSDAQTKHYNQIDVKRARLPKFLSWYETPDEMLPGGLYEPTVLSVYKKFGWYVCSYYWLAIRNVGHGMPFSKFGKPIPQKVSEMSELTQKEHGVFEKSHKIGWFEFVYGYKSVNDWFGYKTGSYSRVAVPRISFKADGNKIKNFIRKILFRPYIKEFSYNNYHGYIVAKQTILGCDALDKQTIYWWSVKSFIGKYCMVNTEQEAMDILNTWQKKH